MTHSPASHHSAATAALFAAASAASLEATNGLHSSAGGPRAATAAFRAEPSYV